MSKLYPRSRLNISYRTRIEGEPVKQRLPMRFLVLGNLTGNNLEPLEEREIRSIRPGMRVDDFMRELQVTAPIEDKELGVRLAGTLQGRVEGTVKKELDGGKAIIRWTGTGTVSGERDDSQGGFSGPVSISGEVELPLVNEVLSVQSAKLRVVGKVTDNMAGDIDATVECSFASQKLDADAMRSEITATVPVALTIPLNRLSDFAPERVAASVPEIRRKLVLRRLLTEARSEISGYAQFREAFKNALPKAEDDAAAVSSSTLAELQTWLRETYPQLSLNPAAAESAPSTPGPAGGGGAGGGGGSPAPAGGAGGGGGGGGGGGSATPAGGGNTGGPTA
ncbi:type VI secretion system contractile sheath small subunit [Haliangium ochraceum]|uniref:Uncharacterized protein n=1 Tax=Haliangium ochraceum (strain DSM 14365 / JCM 11303 / SMP-2) TaxID=502025 RepID=D0LR41_HALO1|nr:type VI secretion system contractile sheath small subunit [Haliangium ochraceum]ACY15549.1 hypothetical protein Hoch_3043 [Haliangium ochraceum DSM 14365]